MEEDEIDKILQNFEVERPQQPRQEIRPIAAEKMDDYISSKLDQIAQLSIDSIEDVKDRAIASGDGETIAALASLITAASKQLELMSKFALQKHKIANSEKMQDKEHAHKEKMLEKKHEQQKELAGGSSASVPHLQQQNNFYISASREEIMDKLLGDIKSKVNNTPIIDVNES